MVNGRWWTADAVTPGFRSIQSPFDDPQIWRQLHGSRRIAFDCPRGSSQGIPASTSRARSGWTNQSPSWSYRLSTGCNRQPGGQNVLGGVEVPIMDGATVRVGACPRPYLQQ